jgi:phosphomannomutase
MKIYSADEYDPRECVELGAAIGTWLGQNNMIMTGTDGRPISRLVRRALTVGLASIGVTVLDMRMVPDIVLKYEIKRQGMGAGLYVSFDGVQFIVSLFDSAGENIDEKTAHKVKELKEHRKYPKVSIMDLGTVLYYPNGIEDYIDQLSLEVTFRKPLTILADCQTTPIAAIVPGLFERFGIKTTLFNGLTSGYGAPRSKEEFLSNLKHDKYSLGLRFVDVVEIYKPNGSVLDERPNLKDTLLFLKDFTEEG